MTARPSRVLFVATTHLIGGAERLVLTLMKGLERRGVRCVLVCPAPGPLAAEAADTGVSVEILPLETLLPVRGGLSGLPCAVVHDVAHVLGGAARLARLLRRERPDLVQSVSLYGHLCAGLACRLSGVPCLWYFVNFLPSGGWKPVFWKAAGRLLPSRIAAISMAVARRIDVRRKVQVVHGAVEAPVSRGGLETGRLPARCADCTHVAYVGRVAPLKGLDLLAVAAKFVVAADSSVHFWVYGAPFPGDEAYAATVHRIVDDTLPANWHWMGYQAGISADLDAFDMLAVPSRSEALPLATMEALGAGVPVVGFDVGGMPEIVTSGTTGLLVPAEDVEGLAAAVLRLAGSPELRRAMAPRCREVARRFEDVDAYVEAFLRAYGELYRRGQRVR